MKKIFLAVLMVFALSNGAFAVNVGSWADFDAEITNNETEFTLTGNIDFADAGATTLNLPAGARVIGGGSWQITGPMTFFTVAGGAAFENVVFNNANTSAPAVSITGGTVGFTNGKFTNNSVTAVETAGTTTFTGVEFSSNTGTIVVSVTGGTATFAGGTFSGNNNAAGSIVSVTGGTATFTGTASFTNNVAKSLLVNGGTAELTGATFSGNTGTAGVAEVSSGSAKFSNCTFSGNTNSRVLSVNGSGTATVEGGTSFTNNTLGAIAINAGNLNIGQATFDGNGAAATNGGAIDITGGTVTFANTGTQTIFRNNKATGNGGALNITGGNVQSTAGTFSFQGNTAANGGAIYTTVAITDTVLARMSFSENEATTAGGAIYTDKDITVSANVNFSKNKATGATADGGAIYAFGSTITVSNGTFDQNTATRNGGALYSSSAVANSISISGGTFSNNTATNNGGAVYSAGAITIPAGTFTSNTATVDGGAVFSNSAAANAVSVSGGAFTSNTATTRGGAICAIGGMSVSGGTFSQNKTIAATSPNEDGGGAIWCNGIVVEPAGSGAITFSGNESGNRGGAIFSNTAAARIESTTFDQNKATYGAGVYLNGAATVTNCVFKGNNAITNGGAIHLAANATIQTSSFQTNTASSSGGGIYLPGTLSTQNILQCFFKGNTAPAGGAIHQPGGTDQTVAVVRSYFESNKSTGGRGGAINIAGTRFDLSQSTFTLNEATGGAPSRGGAVSCNAQSYGIVNTTFVGNKIDGTGYGGALYLDTDAGRDLLKSSSVFYCTFTDNNASDGMGGGLYSSAMAIMLEANVLVGNTATTGRDIFRTGGNITSGGYNVICNYGSNAGGGNTGNVDWLTESGVVGLKAQDKFDSTYTRALLFGTNALDAQMAEKQPYGAGSSLDPSLQSWVTTLKLKPNDASATVLNPALGILPGTTGAMNYTSYFNGTVAGVWYEHHDARGVVRNSNSTTEVSGGLVCDAGAYQTIDSSGPGPGPGGAGISHVQIGGLPNFTLRVGQTCTLASSVYVYNTSTGGVDRSLTEAVNWRSSNPNVAHIDNYGNLILLGLGESVITLSSVNNSSATGAPATDTVTVRVELDQSHTNIAYEVWAEMATFNATLARSGVQVYLADADPSTVQSSSFGGPYRQYYGLEPKQITTVTGANGLRFRTSSDYRSSLTVVRPSTGFSMSTLDDLGAMLAMKYVYNLEWADVGAMLGKTVTKVDASDVVALFDSLSLVFTNERGENVVVVDRDGSNGVAIQSALDSGALRVGGANTTDFDSVNSLVMHLDVLVGDASASGRTVNLIDGKIVVADNEANGRIDGEMWLLKDASASGGGGGGGGSGGGGGGGCSVAGVAPLLFGIAALSLASRKKRKK